MAKKKINSKRKGKSGELEAVHLWQSIGFVKAERTAAQHKTGHGLPDIQNVPYWIECKRWSRESSCPSNYAKAWLQAKHDMSVACEKGRIPDLQLIMVMVRVDDRAWECMVEPNIIADIGYSYKFGEIYQFTHREIDENDVILVVSWDSIAPLIRAHYEMA